MSTKRSYSTVVITPVTGAGDAITLEGAEAQSFWQMYVAWLNGKGEQHGFVYQKSVEIGEEDPKTTEIHDVTILFKNVASVDKAPIKATSTTDYDCEDK